MPERGNHHPVLYVPAPTPSLYSGADESPSPSGTGRNVVVILGAPLFSEAHASAQIALMIELTFTTLAGR
jgi:hypothetical protein